MIRAHCNSDKVGEEDPAESAAHQAPRSRSPALTLQGEAPSELDPSFTGRSYGMGTGLVGVIWGLWRERRRGEREAALSLPFILEQVQSTTDVWFLVTGNCT